MRNHHHHHNHYHHNGNFNNDHINGKDVRRSPSMFRFRRFLWAVVFHHKCNKLLSYSLWDLHYHYPFHHYNYCSYDYYDDDDHHHYYNGKMCR
jgi:hypothetical protein